VNSYERGVIRAPLDATEVADRILDVVPRLMRRIRREMRAEGAPGLSIPQFRILVRVGRVPDLSLTALADDLGMSASAASNLVDRLVRAGELERTVDPDERRRVRLRLSSSGLARVGRARHATQAWLSHEILQLPGDEIDGLTAALDVLARIGEGGT
jgi:MarR family transcriptional regulator for hemolysin